MVEILGSGSSSQAEKETQEKASSLTETLKLTAGKTRSLTKHPSVHQEVKMFLLVYSESDLLLKAPRWSLLSAVPVGGSAVGASSSE